MEILRAMIENDASECLNLLSSHRIRKHRLLITVPRSYQIRDFYCTIPKWSRSKASWWSL